VYGEDRGRFALLIVLPAAPVRAHHHIGCVYDTATTQPVTGLITEVVWAFPHVHLHLTTEDNVAWDVETVNPQGLRRSGVERDTLEPGDLLTATVWRARTGALEGFSQSLTLPTGRVVAFPIAELTCPF